MDYYSVPGWARRAKDSFIRVLSVPVNPTDYKQLVLLSLFSGAIVLWTMTRLGLSATETTLGLLIYYTPSLAIWLLVPRKLRLATWTLALLQKIPIGANGLELRSLPTSTLGETISSIVWRIMQLVLSILGGAALLARSIMELNGPNSITKPEMLLFYVGSMILTPAILLLVFVPAWTFEDSGIRRNQRSRGVVSVPLIFIPRLATFSGLGSLLSFSISLAGGPLEAFGFIEAALVLSIPLSISLVTIFYNVIRRSAISDLSASFQASP